MASGGQPRSTSGPDRAIRRRPSTILVDEVGVGPGVRVLDLAAGTGKLTRELTTTGADVVAVEPVASMREQLAGVAPGVEVQGGLAEDIPLAASSVDVVTCAQAFHWFDAPLALAEVARVLRPAGSLALIWNVRDESVDWVHRMTEIIVERSGGTPYRRDHTFGSWSSAVADTGAFEPLRQARFTNAPEATIDLVVGRAASTSFVAALPTDEREMVLDEVRSMLEDHPDVPVSGTFPFPHETDVYWCRRRG
ncbi:MAG: methyltransferase domain-containing protein [Acidimicrobiia bacterium]|nr:methyltransferase domain-containing protein [Acidimicrobiia bacterium]